MSALEEKELTLQTGESESPWYLKLQSISAFFRERKKTDDFQKNAS